MSETTHTATVHEAYSFACMRCGHGWEQSYEIEHHTDPAGEDFVVYKTDGRRVPSPLSSPTCGNCGGHVVRIMQPGRVSTVRTLMGLTEPGTAPPVSSVSPAEPVTPVAAPVATAPPPSGPTVDESTADPGTAQTEPEAHHWHLSDLLHPFHHRK
ncbi:hypothetical protein [Streptomyces peucetius]|nr:hypothetical protein CGZ69_14525 [Streptomyces peucetius subsp. caesius ATCC 27952]